MPSTCYKIHAGRITETEIPITGLLLVASRESLSGINVIALTGVEDDDWASYTLGCVADIATTITPWATWYCSPAARNDGQPKETTWGCSYTTRDASG